MGLFTVVIGADKQIIGVDGRTRPYRWYHAIADSIYGWWSTRDWRRRQNEFKRTGTRYYGDGGTIHSTGHLDIETFHGTVVAVWFRCQPLPFEQHEVDGPRAIDMESMYGNPKEGKPAGALERIELHGVEVRDVAVKP